jgi:hypothetical protein
MFPVNIDVDEEESIQTCFIRRKDRRNFPIDKILYKCRATSQKVEGDGICYTRLIKGKEFFLFHEGDKWFIEAKGGKNDFILQANRRNCSSRYQRFQ